MDIVVTGAAGRLGAAMARALSSAGHRVTPLLRSDLDVCDGPRVAAVMHGLRPRVIVNCAAYNAVDAAEANPAAAFAANALGPAWLARAARELDALFMHFSSDFVFDGCATTPYGEDDAANPLNTYAASKLAGEHEARTAPRHCILRVASLFGGLGVRGHRPTVDCIVDGLEQGTLVRALVDRTVTPSYVPDVARAAVALVDAGVDGGIYHCVNSGVTNWFELALHVAELLGRSAAVEPVTATELGGAARRPRYCALSNAKLDAAGVAMPTWQSAIRRHVADRARAAAPHLMEVC